MPSRGVLDIPQPLLLLSVVLFMIFFGVQCYRVRLFRRSSPWDFNLFMRTLMTSLGLGFSIGMAGFPALWFAFLFPVRGGTFEENLPPGINPGMLIAILLAGALALIGWALKSYFDVRR